MHVQIFRQAVHMHMKAQRKFVCEACVYNISYIRACLAYLAHLVPSNRLIFFLKPIDSFSNPIHSFFLVRKVTSLGSIRSMCWDLFSVIGGLCKRYVVTLTRISVHNCLPGLHLAASVGELACDKTQGSAAGWRHKHKPTRSHRSPRTPTSLRVRFTVALRDFEYTPKDSQAICSVWHDG